MKRAIFWNNDHNKEVPSDIFIVSTLKRAYNDFVIDKLVAFFGEEMVLHSLERHKHIVSDTQIKCVTDHIQTSLVST